MSRSLLSVGALVLLLAIPAAAPAWWHFGQRPAPVVAGYAPAPVVFVAPRPVFVAAPVLVPVAPPAPACTAPASPFPAVAAPAPAPPSGSPEPPLAKPGPPMPPAQPSAYQAASPAAGARAYDTYPLALRGVAAVERCSISFWNLTGRDVVLRVEGQTQVLPRGRSLTRELPRTFAWQVDGGEQRTEQVSVKDGGLEVVLRW